MPYQQGDRIVRFSPSFLPFRVFFYLMLVLVKAIDWLVFRLRIEGREHLRGLERAVLVSNHTLLMDPAVLAHAIRPRRTYFTMLEETAMIPFLGTFVRLLGAIPIPEAPASVRMLERGFAAALSGLGFVHFFPEGELYRWNQALRPFRPGAFLIACRLKVPVLPLTIVLRERRLWGRSSFGLFGRTIHLPPRVVVVIGEPVFAAPAVRTTGTPSGTAPGFRTSLRGTAEALGLSVRRRMQATIDAKGGARSLYRGAMPRLTAGIRTTIPVR
jgi:1-acyl-sn-glycerol-3-phosphate acyltransferase